MQAKTLARLTAGLIVTAALFAARSVVGWLVVVFAAPVLMFAPSAVMSAVRVRRTEVGRDKR